MRTVEVETEYIKLDSLLKLAVFAQSGGEAKFLIQEGMVLVNGLPCLERGKKIRAGDIVLVSGEEIIVLRK